ncbi:MAG: PTS sugar transporter subunit IIA [Atopobium sp.]|uniref:PTS sugar transporter subunit IIA n=1 Tax=Atopobium sp. TaxID=1872650 RepID=UPI002A753FFE|nr:PTS sugar transporter subunit IIA [Atopobium sp.]MDY2787944.1 PTS sugar transporter subunit IIA [Atopobium sp.]MDY4523367.1 PTS sugar transporter subunit IIA [Atopobium sp.]
MLKFENVQILQSVKDWEQSVHVAVQPLVDGGYAEARYIDGIIANAKELGPYFVLCPDLALLHARPEQGALKQQLAVTVLREPVRFKEEGPDVRLLVTLVATDSDSHINVMRQLAMMFGDPANIAKVVEATSEQEIYDLFLAQE